MTRFIKIFAKFPCDLLEMNVRRLGQRKFSKSVSYDFAYPERLYVTYDGGLLFTTEKLRKNQIVNLKNLKLEKIILKDVRYKRNSSDFKNELFVHTFNGSEKFYTCNLKNNLVYYVLGYKDLWEREIHK